MKRGIFLILFLLLAKFFYGNDVNVEKAKVVAKNFMDLKFPQKSNNICNVIEEKYKNVTVYFIISFCEGGWVMVSADDSVIPILGYSFKGIIDKSSIKPDNYNNWVNNYKEQIIEAKSKKNIYPEITKKWEELLNPKSIKKSKDLVFSYTPGTALLNTADRGKIEWSQSKNNNGGCIPSYNQHTPPSSDSDCDCDHKMVGCGPVAMGQIMWYWQWPKSNSYRSYDWDLMPNELTNSSTLAEGEMISLLLGDIGNACKMDNNIEYFCTFSWSTMSNMEDAFVDDFKYKAAEKKVKSEWDYPGAWENLIRSEIDAGRPVLYYGDKSDLSTSKHYFVCDGYDSSDPEYFHFNFGWGYPGNSYNTSFQYLDDLTPGSHEYNKNHKAIVGISPSRNTVTNNITDVSYSSITGIKQEVAKYNISLPSSNEMLIVKNGGKLMLTAGNSIRLNPGFSVDKNSEFKATIEEIGLGVSGISVSKWYNAFTPNGDGINDELFYNVYNADTWELQAFDRNGYAIFQSAGVIENNKAIVWKGENTVTGVYYCILKFRNSCGEVLAKDIAITVLHGKSKEAEVDELNVKVEKMSNFENEILEADFNLSVFPNPSNGNFNLSLNNWGLGYKVIIYSIMGEIIYNRENIHMQTVEINLDDKKAGIYILKVEINNKCIIRKIIKN